MQTAVQQLIHDIRNIDMSIFNDEHCKKYLEMEKKQKQEEYLRGYKEGINSGSTYHPD